jgi:hypothetical protein
MITTTLNKQEKIKLKNKQNQNISAISKRYLIEMNPSVANSC